MHSTTASQTRRLTDAMRAIATGYAGTFARANLTVGVTLDRSRNRRVYRLDYWNTVRAGMRVSVDVTARELWIRPVSRATRHDDPLDGLTVTLAAETRHIDALMADALAAGFTLNQFSETPETLAAWRANRSAVSA